jgi:serine/threonine protein kinase
MSEPKPNCLFVCYSHTDAKYKERFDAFLKGGALKEAMKIFSDADIRPGEDWHRRISDALSEATAALVLVSQDFMISPFIQQVELRDLLTSHFRRGLRLFLVPVRSTYYQGTYLERFQWARPPDKPLSLLVEQEQERAMVEVCQLIATELKTPADQPTIENTIRCIESIPRLDLPAIYELQGFVGEGEFARCYLAKDRLLDRDVIIKVLNEELSRDSPAYDRYIGSVARLKHRNILGVHFSQTSKLPHFIVTPSIDKTLNARMEAEDPALRPTYGQALHWTIQIAETLHYAHGRKCVHGRLRPEEVRLDESDQPILAGFRTADSLIVTPFCTRSERISLKDFWYASPEMRRGETFSEKSDQYLLGLLAYEMIAADSKPDLSSWNSLLSAGVAGAIENPRPLCEIARECSARVSKVIMKALAPDPAHRWENLDVFARSLERAMSDRGCIEAAKESYRRCAQSPEFYRTVYDELFARMPAARAMFRNTSLERQYQVLRDSMWLLLKFSDARDASEPTLLSAVARTHARRTAKEYDLFRDAILAAVMKHDSPAAAEDWAKAIAPGFEYLKKHTGVAAGTADEAATPRHIVVEPRGQFVVRTRPARSRPAAAASPAVVRKRSK